VLLLKLGDDALCIPTRDKWGYQKNLSWNTLSFLLGYCLYCCSEAEIDEFNENVKWDKLNRLG